MGGPPITGITCLLYTARENNIFPQNMVTVYPEMYISLERHQHQIDKISEWSKNGSGIFDSSYMASLWLVVAVNCGSVVGRCKIGICSPEVAVKHMF